MSKIKFEVEMDIKTMTLEELMACGMSEEEAKEFDSAGLEEYPPDEIADCLVSVLNNEDAIREGFGGSNIYVTVADAKLLSSEIDD